MGCGKCNDWFPIAATRTCFTARGVFPRTVINRLIIGRFLEKTANERGRMTVGYMSPLITAIHLSGQVDHHLSSNFVVRVYPGRRCSTARSVAAIASWIKSNRKNEEEFYRRTGTNDCSRSRNRCAISR